MKVLSWIVRKSLFFIVFFALIGGMGFIGLYLYAAPQIPEVSELREVRLQTPMRIFTHDGKLIQEFGDVRRIPVTLDQVPQHFIDALIATEDRRFFEHSGVDFKSLLRAAVAVASSGSKTEGGSTLTMQTARNFFLTRDKTYTRKIIEIFTAFRIEQELTKTEILELYVNKTHFSHRAYGLGAAAQVYYGKDLQDLTLPQLAVLAGIPKGESEYNPISSPQKALGRRNIVLKNMLLEGYIDQPLYTAAIESPITATKHGADIEAYAPYIAEMVRQDVIDRFGKEMAYNDGLVITTTIDSELQANAEKALQRGVLEYDKRHGYRGASQNFSDIDSVAPEDLVERLADIPILAGIEAAIVTEVLEQSVTAINSAGDTITIDWGGLSWAKPFISDDRFGEDPKTASDILKKGDLISVISDADNRWTLTQLPEVAAGFVALKPANGAIKALVGGFEFNQSKFNLVTQARRQPGSNIKPFVYSAALDRGFTAASVVNDAPFVQVNEAIDEVWRPKNDSGKYKGPTRLRVALRNSTNTVSVRLVQAIGAEYTKEYLQRFGFPEEVMEAVPSLALGTPGLTPLEVARGYAVFANGGFLVTPHYIERVESADGLLLYRNDTPRVCETCDRQAELKIAKEEAGLIEETFDDSIQNYPVLPLPETQIAPRVIEKRNAYIVADMMEGVIRRGTAYSQLNRNNSPLLARTDLGGKTGTTNDARDAWFSGGNQDFVATTWVGFSDHRRSLGSREYGGRAALPIWQYFMEVALKEQPNHEVQQPPGIVSARINPETGLLASLDNPNAQFELFRSENVPEKESRFGTNDVFNSGTENDTNEPIF